MYDKAGNILRWNKKLQETTGYSDFELTYKSPAEYFVEDKALVESKIEQVFEEGNASLEATLVNKNGNKDPYLFNATLFEGSDQEFMIGTGIKYFQA